jgi:hypothetical protein
MVNTLQRKLQSFYANVNEDWKVEDKLEDELEEGELEENKLEEDESEEDESENDELEEGELEENKLEENKLEEDESEEDESEEDESDNDELEEKKLEEDESEEELAHKLREQLAKKSLNIKNSKKKALPYKHSATKSLRSLRAIAAAKGRDFAWDNKTPIKIEPTKKQLKIGSLNGDIYDKNSAPQNLRIDLCLEHLNKMILCTASAKCCLFCSRN